MYTGIIVLPKFCTCMPNFNFGYFDFYKQSRGERQRYHPPPTAHPISLSDAP